MSVALIGFASGLGARHAGCADGPLRLRTAGLDAYLRERSVEAQWRAMLEPENTAQRELLTRIEKLNERLQAEVAGALRNAEMPMVIGGDHTSAVGTWRGTLAGVGHGPLGLLWVDAHMDAHTPESSHTKLLHGMPLAVLLGHCGENAPPCEAVLRPEHVCIVGARSYENEEAALLEEEGVRIYHMEEIHRRGLLEVMREAQARVRTGTATYGITVDVDSIDPLEAPGVGTPEAGGLAAQELLVGLQRLVRAAPPAAVEIAEFNPHADRRDATLRIVMELACSLSAHLAHARA